MSDLTSEQKLTSWVVRVGNEHLLIDGTAWECSGNGLKFYNGQAVAAWFVTWDYFYEEQ